MTDTRVYFIRSVRSKAVKIGVAENPRQRLSSMQTGSIARLELLAEMPGDERYERVLHEVFAEYRIRGEWFRLEGRLATFVSMLPVMYAIKTRKHLVRERAPLKEPDPRVHAYWTDVMLPAVRAAVLAFGVENFSKVTGRRRGVIVRAIYDRGVHFAYEDFATLCAVADKDTAYHLMTLMVRPFGFRVITPEQKEEERKQAEKYKRLRDEIIAVLGADDGRAWLDSHDREIAEEKARRQAEFDANPWALPAGVQ